MLSNREIELILDALVAYMLDFPEDEELPDLYQKIGAMLD